MDESAKGDLIRSFFTYRDSRPEVGHAGVALGRMRAFEVFSIMSEWDLANWDSIGPASHFLLGLVDASNAGPSECKGKEPWDCFRRLIREKAREEAWSADDLASTIALTTVIEHPRLVQPPQLRQGWQPPDTLRGMPDPLDKEKTTKFIQLHPDKFLDILEDGDLEDKIKVLMVLAHCEAIDLVDPVLAVRLMGASHYSIHNIVGRAISDGRIALSPIQLEYCARCIGWTATNRALHWMRTNPRPEYRPTLRKLLLDGRHLFQQNLYIAITENEAVQCADVLRSFLETEHYAIRFNAAVTLFSLGDDSVLPLLQELLQTRRSCSSCLSSTWTKKAMATLE